MYLELIKSEPKVTKATTPLQPSWSRGCLYGRDGGHEVAGPSGASVERNKHVVEEVMDENSSDIGVTYICR